MEGNLTDSAETRELLRQVEDGDDSAFQRLFARHRAWLLELVRLRRDDRLRRKVDPSDLVQETQLEAVRRLPDFLQRRPMPFHLWLRKTAHERVIMMHRQYLDTGRRDLRREMPLPERSSVLLAQRIVASDVPPSQKVARSELARKVRRAVAQLPEADREILLMHTFEGLSYAEAAYILGITEESAKKRHGRALIRLQKLLLDPLPRESRRYCRGRNQSS